MSQKKEKYYMKFKIYSLFVTKLTYEMFDKKIILRIFLLDEWFYLPNSNFSANIIVIYITSYRQCHTLIYLFQNRKG